MEIEPLIAHAAQQTGISAQRIRRDRSYDAARVRYAIIKAARPRSDYSDTRLANAIGLRDRKNVPIACRRADEIASKDPAYAQLIAELEALP